MKNNNLFYLFLLGLIALYFFSVEYASYNNMEGFIDQIRRKDLYEKYQDDFKQSNVQFGEFSNDLDLFVQATDALMDEYNPDSEPTITSEEMSAEPIIPEQPKGPHTNISNKLFDKYDIEPKQDTLTALQGELTSINDTIAFMKNEPYADEDKIKEYEEEKDGIMQLIAEEMYKKQNPSV